MQPKPLPSHRIYSGSTAFKFEPTLPDATTGHAMLCIEGAEGSPKAYDWHNKIRITVMERELPLVLSVLLGFEQAAQFSFHGQERNKSYSLSHKDGELLIGLHQAGRRITGKLAPHDRFYASSVCLNVLARQLQMPHQATLELVKHSQGFLGQGG